MSLEEQRMMVAAWVDERSECKRKLAFIRAAIGDMAALCGKIGDHVHGKDPNLQMAFGRVVEIEGAGGLKKLQEWIVEHDDLQARILTLTGRMIDAGLE